MKIPPVVEVEWIDASSYSGRGWLTHESAVDYKPFKVLSSGYLLRKDDAVVILGINKDPNGSYSVLMEIPRGMVRKIKTIRKAIKK